MLDFPGFWPSLLKNREIITSHIQQPSRFAGLVIRRHSYPSFHTCGHSANRTCWSLPAVELSIWTLTAIITALNIRTGYLLVQGQTITNTFYFMVSEFLVCLCPSVEGELMVRLFSGEFYPDGHFCCTSTPLEINFLQKRLGF